MLIRLLRTYLRPYRKLLASSWSCCSSCRRWRTLFLPTLNADIIDKGVVTGDTAYIWRTARLMLVVTLVQVVFAIAAVYFGVQGGDGLRPRRARRRCSTRSPTSRPRRSATSARRR